MFGNCRGSTPRSLTDAFCVARCKDRLAAALDGLLDLVAVRILPFDTAAQCQTRRQGARRRGFPRPEGYLAATRPRMVRRDAARLECEQCLPV